MAQILLVDDDTPVRETLADFLETAGHTVTHAGDGLEAMDLFATQPFDLVVTDIVMPNREGLETILHMKERRPDTKIIAISGISGMADVLEIATDFGADRVLSKPISMEAFLEAVDHCLAET